MIRRVAALVALSIFVVGRGVKPDLVLPNGKGMPTYQKYAPQPTHPLGR